MAFATKIDLSNNRQVKQNIETTTILSGATTFGVPYNFLPSGASQTSSGVTVSYSSVVSTFSGNSASTVYSWFDSRMNIALNIITPITPSNSASTQTTGNVFVSNITTLIDGNSVPLSYSGVNFDITPTSFINLGGGNYSGSVITNSLKILSADTTNYTGRTIWVDVSGITRTNEIIITKNPTIGYVLTCIDNEGKVSFKPLTGSTSSIITGGTYSNGTTTLTNSTGGTVTITGYTTPFTGGTVTGNTIFTGNLSASTISATTYNNLPNTNGLVTGGTYSNGTTILTNSSGGTVTITGYTTPFTGGIVTGNTIFTSNLSASTISATTYNNLPNTNGLVTGGTYSNGTTTLTNNTGGTVTITGYTTPFTGGTVTGNTIFTGNLSATTISATTYNN